MAYAVSDSEVICMCMFTLLPVTCSQSCDLGCMVSIKGLNSGRAGVVLFVHQDSWAMGMCSVCGFTLVILVFCIHAQWSFMQLPLSLQASVRSDAREEIARGGTVTH